MLNVVQQRILPLIDEYGRGGVEGLQVNHAVPDAAFADNFVDPVRDIDQLHAVVGNPVNDPIEDSKAG